MCFFTRMGHVMYGGVFFFQAEDGIRDGRVTGVQTCALPISWPTSAGTPGSTIRARPRPAAGPHCSRRRPTTVAWGARCSAVRRSAGTTARCSSGAGWTAPRRWCWSARRAPRTSRCRTAPSPAAPAPACSTCCATSAWTAPTCSSTRSCTRSSASTPTTSARSPRTLARRSWRTATGSSTRRSSTGTRGWWSRSATPPRSRSPPGSVRTAAAPIPTISTTPPSVACPAGCAWPGWSTSAIKADFQRACNRIKGWLDADAGWLPADPGVPRDLGAPFQYKSAAIPYRDFPFGTCPRLGRGGTSSNRTDAQRGIRLFSAGGAYNAAGAHLQDPSTATGSRDGYDDPGDLPYEPPRAGATAFDPGPPSSLARLLLGLEPGLGWPDFAALGVTSHASFGAGPLYRGRFQDLSLAVLADQASDDDLFTGRALSGDAGQRLARFLRAAGLTSSYLVLRTLPVDTLDLTQTRRDSLVDQPKVQALHRELLHRVCSQNPKARVLLALGPGAQRLAAQVAPVGVEVIPLAMAGTSGAAAPWQAALDQLATRSYPKDIANPSFQLPSGRGQIPRIDLPYGTLRWVEIGRA